MTKILAIETATEACSAALLIDDKVITSFKIAPREHTKLILSMMEEVLEKSQIKLKEIDAVAFSRGPGAFTGLRIAAGVAQGVALSVDKPVIPVSTLACMALQAVDQLTENNEKIIVALDARMGEVYWAVFEFKNGKVVRIGEEQVTKPEEMLANAQNNYQATHFIAIGTGWDEYQENLAVNTLSKINFIEKQLPSAESIAILAKDLLLEGKAVTPEKAQPVYIRNKVAEKSKKIA